MDCCMDSTKNTLKLRLQWILSHLPSNLSIYIDGNFDNFHSLKFFSIISSMRGEIDEQLVKLDNWLSLWNIQDISRIYPSQGTQAMLTQETKKV